jgi:hypothetical protein
VTPQMTSDAASNGPQPFFPYPLTEDQLLGQHFLGYYRQAVKAKEPEVCPRVASTVSSAEKPPLATTTSAPTTAATYAPALRQRMAAAPKRTGRSSLLSLPQEREWDHPRTRVPPSRRTTCCATPRCSRPQSLGRRTECCTLARQQQFAFPRMARGRLLRRAGGWFPPPDAGGRSGSSARTETGPDLPRPPPQQG